jgi:hypothetical protein
MDRHRSRINIAKGGFQMAVPKKSAQSHTSNPIVTSITGTPEPDTIASLVLRLFDGLILAKVARQDADDTGRLWSCSALREVIDFIERAALSAGPPLVVPLRKLREALVELENGTTDPILKPKELTGGRRTDTVRRSILHGVSAAVMSTLMQMGLSRKEAADKVAKVLIGKGIKIAGRNGLNWNSVAQWRDQVRSGRVHRAVRDCYEVVLEQETEELERARTRSSQPFSQGKHVEAVLNLLNSNIDRFYLADF